LFGHNPRNTRRLSQGVTCALMPHASRCTIWRVPYTQMSSGPPTWTPHGEWWRTQPQEVHVLCAPPNPNFFFSSVPEIIIRLQRRAMAQRIDIAPDSSKSDAGFVPLAAAGEQGTHTPTPLAPAEKTSTPKVSFLARLLQSTARVASTGGGGEPDPQNEVVVSVSWYRCRQQASWKRPHIIGPARNKSIRAKPACSPR
jgi:hypothetical protein